MRTSIIKFCAKRMRLLPLALFVMVFFVAPQPAHAQCDGCVVDAITGSITAIGQTDAYADLLSGIVAELATVPVDMPLFLVALYGASIPPVGGIDSDVVDGFGQVNGALNLLATQAVPMAGQVIADSIKQYHDTKSQAELAPKALLSELSTHCAVTYGFQARNAMEGFVRVMTRATMQLIAERSAGPSAGRPGINSTAELLCENAPFIANSTRYSNNISAAIADCKKSDAVGASPVPAYLVDGSSDIDSVFKRLQLALPDKVTQLPDNHISFTPGNDGEWEFVAAWRFCESYIPEMPAPPNSSSTDVNADQVVQAFYDRRVVIAKNFSSVHACMEAMAYRTACSNGQAGDFTISAIGNCWQIQDVACSRLTNSPPGGLGITSTGNADADYALANCKTDGLSAAMFDYIYSHRCADINYMTAVVPDNYGKANAVDKERAACADDLKNFDERINAQKEYFTMSIRGIPR